MQNRASSITVMVGARDGTVTVEKKEVGQRDNVAESSAEKERSPQIDADGWMRPLSKAIKQEKVPSPNLFGKKTAPEQKAEDAPEPVPPGPDMFEE